MRYEASQALSPLCPSARPEMTDSVVFGVVGGESVRPRVAYVDELIPVTEEVMALAGPVAPTRILRIGAPCAGHSCRHFDGANCRLATRVVELLHPVVDGLPACQLRPECRWWQQEGKAACVRCPQVVSDLIHPSELILRIANPNSPTGRSDVG